MGRIAVAAVVSLWVIPISILVNRIVPDPYMDEIFHIPQAQQYCNGNFRSWDPMITTPPGLYYLSLAHVASLFPGIVFTQVASSSFSEACSIPILRSTNGILAVLCSIIVYEIISHLRPNLDDKKATLYAVILALYPLHWFFTFLYYTDVASLTAVLAMYLASLKKNYWLSALFGIFAVVIRQTNIIWMLFVASSGVIDITLTHYKDNQIHENDALVEEFSPLNAKGRIISSEKLRKRKFNRTLNADKQFLHSRRLPSSNQKLGLVDEIRDMLSTMWCMKSEILVSFSPFMIVLMAFISFVRWNGSVVLGAKEAHAVSPHFAQIMYFSLFSALCMAPVHCNFSQVIDLFDSFWKSGPLSFIQIFAALLAGLISIQFFSIAHPYLLADNRHYPFYLWRKVINAHWSMKYLLVPAYMYSWFSIFSILGKFRRKIWVLAFFLATAAVLVPAPLIEFRYYTTPFFFLMLHSHKNDTHSWLLIALLYIALNVFTMIMFLFRPFYWKNESGMQRFIW